MDDVEKIARRLGRALAVMAPMFYPATCIVMLAALAYQGFKLGLPWIGAAHAAVAVYGVFINMGSRDYLRSNPDAE